MCNAPIWPANLQVDMICACASLLKLIPVVAYVAYCTSVVHGNNKGKKGEMIGKTYVVVRVEES